MKMPRSTRAQRRLVSQSVAVSLAAPQVVAHRLARLAAADRHEAWTMGAEKVAAFHESWAAMGMAAWQAQAAMAASFWRSMSPLALMASGGTPAWPSPATLAQQATRVLAQGFAPVHRRATANARRLGRKR